MANDSSEQQLVERDRALVAMKEHLRLAQERMKKFADLKRRKVNLNVGDAVYFKLRLYHQKTLAQKCCEKLAPRFYSPYQVEE